MEIYQLLHNSHQGLGRLRDANWGLALVFAFHQWEPLDVHGILKYDFHSYYISVLFQLYYI
jgi:hypothetical protein